MALPFTIKYTRSFDKKFTEDEKAQVLFYIQDFIRKKSAKNIDVLDNSLFYKGSTSAFNWNIFVAVDKGIFKIEDNGDKSVIIYEIFMYQLFIFVSIAFVIGSIFTQLYLPIAVVTFGWLGGMNWITALMRHGDMFNEIKEGINELLWPKPPEEVKEPQEGDWAKGELKSWF